MTNFEKYKNVLKKWPEKDQVALLNNKPVDCYTLSCGKCDLKKPGVSCSTAFVKWLYEEYKEEFFLSKRAYYFLKLLPKSARVKIDSDNYFIIQDCDIIYKVDYRDKTNIFIPALTLERERWYEVSELLKWKVEEDE